MEENKNEELQEQVQTESQEEQKPSSNARFMLWTLAGIYLLYTGYSLCKGFITGAEGTGIGFMTTFETMKETKASLIIDEMREMSNTDYTKSVTIRFDGKNEYRIKSYRSDEIKKKMKDNRIIIENKKGSSTQWN